MKGTGSSRGTIIGTAMRCATRVIARDGVGLKAHCEQLTDAQWQVCEPPLPDGGERGLGIEDKRRTVTAFYGWGLQGCCAPARRSGVACRNDTAIASHQIENFHLIAQ